MKASEFEIFKFETFQYLKHLNIILIISEYYERIESSFCLYTYNISEQEIRVSTILKLFTLISDFPINSLNFSLSRINIFSNLLKVSNIVKCTVGCRRTRTQTIAKENGISKHNTIFFRNVDLLLEHSNENQLKMLLLS